MARDGVALHSFKPERGGLAGVFLWVADVDRLFDELVARGAIVQMPPTDQTWGIREAHFRDPDGNGAVCCDDAQK